MSKNDELLEKKKVIYMCLEDFKYILVYLDVWYAILITGCLNYL